MNRNALALALADTWEPENDFRTIVAFDDERGGDLAARVCARLVAAPGGNIDLVTDSGWTYLGRATVGASGCNYNSVPYIHSLYTRTLKIEGSVATGDGQWASIAVLVESYRYGKRGKVRCANRTAAEMLGVQPVNGAHYVYDSSAKKFLALQALGLQTGETT